MSHATSTKQRVNWEPVAPTCAGCMFFRSAHHVLINSLPRFQSALCLTHTFKTKPSAVCDSWKDRNTGQELEESTSAKASRIHHPDNPNQCRVCNRLFGSSRAVFNHYHDTHGNRVHKQP